MLSDVHWVIGGGLGSVDFFVTSDIPVSVALKDIITKLFFNHRKRITEQLFGAFWTMKSKRRPFIFNVILALKYGQFHLLFLIHDHFIKPKAKKRKIPFLVTKRGRKSNLIEFSDPRPQHCGRFDLLSFPQDHFTKPKADKHKIQFLATKSGQKLNQIEFSDPQPQ